jgi:hypothetical protein
MGESIEERRHPAVVLAFFYFVFVGLRMIVAADGLRSAYQ